MAIDPPLELPAALQRRLGLPLLVLYGTGVTIGAGIYVLIGAVAGHAGSYAPWAFVLAGLVMALTVASYAELSTRFPVSAGEAAYVRAAFQSLRLIWHSAQRARCANPTCRRDLDWTNFTIDHIKPHALGGPTEPGNAALLCKSCNSKKGARPARSRG